MGTIRLLMLVAVLLVPATTQGQAKRIPYDAATADKADLMLLEASWNGAHMRGDSKSLGILMAEDISVIVPGMPIMNKAAALGVLAAAGFTLYESSDIIVRNYGDTAMVIGRIHRIRDGEGETGHDFWLFTKVYRRSGDAWRVVAFQASKAGE